MAWLMHAVAQECEVLERIGHLPDNKRRQACRNMDDSRLRLKCDGTDPR